MACKLRIKESRYYRLTTQQFHLKPYLNRINPKFHAGWSVSGIRANISLPTLIRLNLTCYITACSYLKLVLPLSPLALLIFAENVPRCSTKQTVVSSDFTVLKTKDCNYTSMLPKTNLQIFNSSGDCWAFPTKYFTVKVKGYPLEDSQKWLKK